jgi:hypothetical protein
MRIAYLWVALGVLMVFGVAYAFAAEGNVRVQDNELTAVETAADEMTDLEIAAAEEELGVYDSTDDLTDAADDGAQSGDKLKRAHENTTNLGGCGW